MKNLQDLINQTIDWNIKVGNKSHPAFTMEFERAAEKQSGFILEEAQETFDNSVISDYTEMLDGACDVLFTLAYYIKLLEDAGFNFEDAYQAVIDNNMTKVYNSFYEASEARQKLEDKHDKEFFVETNIHNGLPFYVIRDGKGKVCKPVDFVPVDLEEYIPK